MTNYFHQWRIREKSYWYISIASLHLKLWTVENFKILTSRVQCPESIVQGPESSGQSPDSSVQDPTSRVQRSESSVRVLRPKSSVQCPASTFQCPTLALEFRNSCMSFSSLILSRSSRPEVFCKTGVLKSSAKLIRKHLCWNLFLIKL